MSSTTTFYLGVFLWVLFCSCSSSDTKAVIIEQKLHELTQSEMVLPSPLALSKKTYLCSIDGEHRYVTVGVEQMGFNVPRLIQFYDENQQLGKQVRIPVTGPSAFKNIKHTLPIDENQFVVTDASGIYLYSPGSEKIALWIREEFNSYDLIQLAGHVLVVSQESSIPSNQKRGRLSILDILTHEVSHIVFDFPKEYTTNFTDPNFNMAWLTADLEKSVVYISFPLSLQIFTYDLKVQELHRRQMTFHEELDFIVTKPRSIEGIRAYLPDYASARLEALTYDSHRRLFYRIAKTGSPESKQSGPIDNQTTLGAATNINLPKSFVLAIYDENFRQLAAYSFKDDEYSPHMIISREHLLLSKEEKEDTLPFAVFEDFIPGKD